MGQANKLSRTSLYVFVYIVGLDKGPVLEVKKCDPF